MIRWLKKSRGYTLTELVLVMLILSIFGVTIITLIQSGSHAYQTIIDNKNAESDARLAISCIGVRVRRNDITGGVRVEKFPQTNVNALVITEEYDGVKYDTWYYYDGQDLRELSFVPQGEALDASNSSIIASVKSFSVEYLASQNAIREQVTYERKHQGQTMLKTMTGMIMLRSDTQGAVTP